VLREGKKRPKVPPGSDPTAEILCASLRCPMRGIGLYAVRFGNDLYQLDSIHSVYIEANLLYTFGFESPVIHWPLGN